MLIDFNFVVARLIWGEDRLQGSVTANRGGDPTRASNWGGWTGGLPPPAHDRSVSCCTSHSEWWCTAHSAWLTICIGYKGSKKKILKVLMTSLAFVLFLQRFVEIRLWNWFVFVCLCACFDVWTRNFKQFDCASLKFVSGNTAVILFTIKPRFRAEQKKTFDYFAFLG